MGYDTYFTIRMEGPEKAKSKVIKEFRKLDTPGFFIQNKKTDEEALSRLEDGFEAHWYDSEEDCQKIAKKNPDVLIIVNGAGEDREDVWEARFKGKLFEESRAVVKNPDILLCDEPTGALDFNTSKEILNLISDLNQKYGSTVIMVTHNDAIKFMADRVIRLRDGMIRKNYTNETKMTADELDW